VEILEHLAACAWPGLAWWCKQLRGEQKHVGVGAMYTYQSIDRSIDVLLLQYDDNDDVCTLLFLQSR
jgi:hypothetical protein